MVVLLFFVPSFLITRSLIQTFLKQDVISPRKCLVCKRNGDFQDLRQCSFCGTKGKEPPFYCIRQCYKTDCRTVNCKHHASCWEAHLPAMEDLRKEHKKVDQLPQIYVNVVTYSEPDPEKQRDLHDEDRIAQWFVVKLGNEEREQARLCVSDRFRRLCNPGISGSRWSSNLYPSFVSFIGATGTGKSTLVRAMILMGQINASGPPSPGDESPVSSRVGDFRSVVAARIHGPVTRTADLNHITDPTSLGVHLYKDILTSDPKRVPRSPRLPVGNNVTPILFADCEGFGGSIAKTNARRPKSDDDMDSEPDEENPNLLFDRPITSPGYGNKGKAGVELFYARFLYAFSDVIVFVTKEDQRFQEDMTNLLEWAASAVNKSINHLAQKTLIIVRNMASHHATEFYDGQFLKKSIFDNLMPLWEGSRVLADFRRTYNDKHRLLQREIRTNGAFFAVFFQQIDVCYIPDKAKAPMDQIFRQYQKLREQIVEASEAGQEVRSNSWTQYNIPTLSHLLNRAFEHFRTSEKPFDFYKAARKDNPNPVSVSDHIANFLRHMKLTQDRVTNMFPKVLSICLVSYALRNFEQGIG